MRLSARIILIVTFALIALAGVLGFISIGELRRTSERHIEVYLSLVLEQYLDQHPRRLSSLLKQHRLDGVDSFVRSYQADAIEAAASSVLRLDARVPVVAMSTGEVLSPTGASSSMSELGVDVSAYVRGHIDAGSLDEGMI